MSSVGNLGSQQRSAPADPAHRHEPPARRRPAGGVALAVAFLVLAVTQWAPWLLAAAAPDTRLGRSAAAVLGAGIFAAAAIWFVGAFLAPRRRGLGWSGDRSWRARVLGGVVVGAAVYGGVFAVRLAVGAVTVDGVRGVEAAAGVLLLGVAVAGYQAVSEEVVFRGALAGLLPRAVRPGVFVSVSVLVFLAFHAPKWPSLLHTPYAFHLVVAGTAFAIAYLRTGSLWLGIGLHAGWNLGAYALLEAPRPLVHPAGPLASGWSEAGGWLAVAGNVVLLVAALAWPARDPARPDVS